MNWFRSTTGWSARIHCCLSLSTWAWKMPFSGCTRTSTASRSGILNASSRLMTGGWNGWGSSANRETIKYPFLDLDVFWLWLGSIKLNQAHSKRVKMRCFFSSNTRKHRRNSSILRTNPHPGCNVHWSLFVCQRRRESKTYVPDCIPVVFLCEWLSADGVMLLGVTCCGVVRG